KVENYVDALASSEVAWTQSADQYFASLRDSVGLNPDLYRTEYEYNGVHSPLVVRNPVFNRVTDYPGTVSAAGDTGALTHYWRLSQSVSPLVDSVGGANGSGTAGVTYSQPGALARDTNSAISLNGTTGEVTAAS